MKSLVIPEALHAQLVALKEEFAKETGRKTTLIEVIAKAINKITVKDLI